MTEQTNEGGPAMVFHAAQIIADEAIARDWTIWEFVERVGTTNAPVEVLAWQIFASAAGAPDLVAGCNPGDSFASDMQRVFGIDADFWERTEALRRQYPERVQPLDRLVLAWYELADDPFTAPAEVPTHV